MPWLALPFANRAEAAATAKRFGIGGIPALVIIDSNGEVINANARGAVSNDAPGGSKFPWAGQQDPERCELPLLQAFRSHEPCLLGLHCIL